jgi:3-hydroxyisobutyrate dehydrogenase-like beta-hydroxyacid dehydrogenase
MGAVVGAAANAEVVWASEGRSLATAERAARAGLLDVGSVAELVASSEIVLSVCPPAIAEEVAAHVFGLGFPGIYVDANAVAPARLTRIAGLGARVVDGSIIGGSEGPRLYLAGRPDDVQQVAALFADTAVEAIPLGSELGAASALKMAYGGWNKIGVALAAQAHAIARAYGVADALEAEGVVAERVVRFAPRAWRWAPEMQEVSDTCAELGLPPEIGAGAAALYARWDEHRDTEVALDRLLDDLVAAEDPSQRSRPVSADGRAGKARTS